MTNTNKRTGEFSLHGEGGARSPYATWYGGGYVEGGERIIPLAEAEAEAWAEKHLSGDQYEALFGAVEE